MIDVDTDDAIAALLRLDYGFFLRFAFRELGGDSDYQHNWHIDAIIHQLDRIRGGDNHRLIVTMPPRHLKSRTITVAWVAWMLGHNPALQFIGVSYGQGLAEDHASDCLKIMNSRWYRMAFPSTVLSRRAVADFSTTAGGGRLSTSVEGLSTGFGADIIIVDDPIKAQDAMSEAARKKNEIWFEETLSQRLNNQENGSIILVMQRLHEADLAGVLRKQEEWHELCLPAIAEHDEIVPLTRGRRYRRREGCALHPARQSLARLMQRKAANAQVFAGQFQQNPIPALGNIIEAPWLQYYEPSTLDLAQGQIVMSMDTASKDNPFSDYSVAVIARVLGKSIHIVDVFRARLKFPDLKAKTIELSRLHNAKVLLVEDAASGTQLIQSLEPEGMRGVPTPIARRPEGDKISRLMGVSAMVQAGRVFLPQKAHWLGDFTSELLGFPAASYDDQVDAFAQLLIWIQDKDKYRAPLNAGPELVTGEGVVWTGDAYEGDPWGA